MSLITQWNNFSALSVKINVNNNKVVHLQYRCLFQFRKSSIERCKICFCSIFCHLSVSFSQVDLNWFELFLCHFCPWHTNRKKNCLLIGGQFWVKIICTISVQSAKKTEDLKGKIKTDNTWKLMSFYENLKYLNATEIPGDSCPS